MDTSARRPLRDRPSTDPPRGLLRDSTEAVQPDRCHAAATQIGTAMPNRKGRHRNRTAGTSGLGLAIVKAIADAHGASVGAANVTTGGARDRKSTRLNS